MATPPGSDACAQCRWLQEEYRRTTLLRLQAEADYMVAVQSRQPAAIQTARHTVRLAIARWTRADRELREHTKTHQTAASAGGSGGGSTY